MSAPPTKDFSPAPVRTMARRSGFWALVVLRAVVREVRRGVLRAFSLLGRVIVRVATGRPVGRRVRVVRILEGGEAILD